jgi:hypothetical protein
MALTSWVEAELLRTCTDDDAGTDCFGRCRMSDAEDDYDAADSGAADCTPIEAGSARKRASL